MICPFCKVGSVYESKKIRRCDRCMADFGLSGKKTIEKKPKEKEKAVVETVRQMSLFDGQFDVFGRYRP